MSDHEDKRSPQEKASDPAASAWVSANAGSGKTTVLVRRAIRLMMADVPPARILALTYTKAAAAHMANEVLRTLSAWVRLDDAALDEKLAEVDPTPISGARRARARRLFAAALETPGGLKVQTIHAFCDRVLHQFPFEARVPAGFDVLEELGERDLLARARISVLFEAANNRGSALGQALAHAVAVASDPSLDKTLEEAVQDRRKLLRFMDESGSGDAVIAAALGLKPVQTLAAVETEIIAGALVPKSEWESVAEFLISLGGNAEDRGDQLLLAALASDSATAVDEYLPVFLTDKNTPRADGQFGSASARNQDPELFARLFQERDRLISLLDKRQAAKARERSAALLTLAAATIRRYEAEKTERGLLDFGDLVTKTADLLSDTGAAWVHYKLDGGIDHILIDEAQDTSPEQWAVIEALAGEFFAGRGAREDRQRTVFAVGDEKQSIFSFQGAEPARFEEMRGAFRQRTEKVRAPFHEERLVLSYRSAPRVLQAIDAVFKRPLAHEGLSSSEHGETIHEAIRKGAPALVEIWPPVQPPATEEEDELAWDAPFDARSETSPPVVLANQIAAAVKFWMQSGFAVFDRQSGATRPARPGDVIVLVRRRGVLFESILRALKNAGVPVAGADRLDLVEHIAVMDLLALADALLLEHDDLALACALKSPLFGLSEDDLYQLAAGRTDTLARALAEQAKSDRRFAEAAANYARWREEARILRPFDFFSRVLSRDGGRARILGRMGIEAADALDEVLARALAYESAEAPSLAGFIAFLRRAGTEVKRDLEVESEAVRVMTVHGVKGLEAPIVMVADTVGLAGDARFDPKLLPLPIPNAPPGAPEAPVWALAAKFDSDGLERARGQARRKREAEYRRLLYVALTRAADALIVCGHDSRPREVDKLPEDCWYRLVHDALKPELVEQDAPGFAGKVWRWRPEALSTAPTRGEAETAPIELPAWLGSAVPEVTRTVRAISPSTAIEPEPARPGARPRLEGLRRGELLHKLLQLLARLAPEQRQDRALRFLTATAGDLAEGLRADLAAEAAAVLGHADCAMLFGENSRAEVPIFARLESERGPIEVTGRIDRLVVTADAIHIADFKTDATPPATPQAAPASYLAQLALYRAAVARLYPEKSVRAHLVWTVKPEIHEIPAELLDAAWRAAIEQPREP
jgi:ATP-dependent helicase/nuclease subunit A